MNQALNEVVSPLRNTKFGLKPAIPLGHPQVAITTKHSRVHDRHAHSAPLHVRGDCPPDLAVIAAQSTNKVVSSWRDSAPTLTDAYPCRPMSRALACVRSQDT